MKTKNYLILFINNRVGPGGMSYCLISHLILLYLTQSIFIKTKVEEGDKFSKIFTHFSSSIKILSYFSIIPRVAIFSTCLIIKPHIPHQSPTSTKRTPQSHGLSLNLGASHLPFRPILLSENLNKLGHKHETPPPGSPTQILHYKCQCFFPFISATLQ